MSHVAEFNGKLLRTVDGVPITEGLAVWTNDLTTGRITLRDRAGKPFVDSAYWDGWFDVIDSNGDRNMANAERVAVRWQGKNAADHLNS